MTITEHMPIELSASGKVKEEQIWVTTKDGIGFKPFGRRIIVKEDEYRTGFECPSCKGTCTTDAVCTFGCKGTGTVEIDHAESEEFPNNITIETCRGCRGKGKLPCLECNGLGVKQGGIIIPQDAERRPMTGTIMSCGDGCKIAKVGMHVAYTQFTGQMFSYKHSPVFKVMEEDEMMVEIRGVLKGHLGMPSPKDIADSGVDSTPGEDTYS